MDEGETLDWFRVKTRISMALESATRERNLSVHLQLWVLNTLGTGGCTHAVDILPQYDENKSRCSQGKRSIGSFVVSPYVRKVKQKGSFFKRKVQGWRYLKRNRDGFWERGEWVKEDELCNKVLLHFAKNKLDEGIE